MKKLFYGLIVALSMAFMLPAYADDIGAGSSGVMPTYSVSAIDKSSDQPAPAAHVAYGSVIEKDRRQISVLFVAVGTASENDSIMGEDDHYKSITVDTPTKIPIVG